MNKLELYSPPRIHYYEIMTEKGFAQSASGDLEDPGHNDPVNWD